jgi:hypothetical protein
MCLDRTIAQGNRQCIPSFSQAEPDLVREFTLARVDKLQQVLALATIANI